ncbi:MAG: hypothetical protein IKZ39_04150, partial [Lachnospiraceae bacterium]|nr:hypothetical protein [Lachnospiraceae bacterium]
SENYIGSIYRFFEADVFAIFDSNGFGLFDVKSGNLVSYHYFSEIAESMYSSNIYNVILSDNGEFLSFTFSEPFSDETYVGILNVKADDFYHVVIPVEGCSALTMHDDNLYCAGYYSTTSLINYNSLLFCIDLKTGKINWKNEAPDYFYEIAASSGFKYIFATGYSTLYVLDAQTGNEISSFNAYSKIVNLVPVDENRAVVFTSDCLKYGFVEGYPDLYITDFFSITPDMSADRFIMGYGKVFIKFNGATYVSLYKYKDTTDDAVLDCEYSLTMCLNDDDLFVRKNGDLNSLEMYSFDSKEPILTMESKYSYDTFVGDGRKYFANYGMGLRIYDISDGSLYKEVDSLDCPSFEENALTNDRNYLYSGRDNEDHIFLYSLTTGKVEEVLKPDIPSDETIHVYGLDKEHYAVKRESGTLEIYKGLSTKPCFTVDRLLSTRDNIKVFGDANIFAIAYLDGTIEFYSFGDTVELIKTYNSQITSTSFDNLKYYPNQKMYVMTVNLKTYMFNDKLEAFAYMPMRADYVPSKDVFVYHSNKSLYLNKRYSYDDLIKESNMLLNDYTPSKITMEKYNLTD